MTSPASFAVVYCPPTLVPGSQAPVLCRAATAADASEFIGSLAIVDPDGVAQGHYGIDGPSPEPVAVPTCPTAKVGAHGQEHALAGCGSTNVAWDGEAMFGCLDCGLSFTPAAALPAALTNA